jgi:hypothetical protein
MALQLRRSGRPPPRRITLNNFVRITAHCLKRYHVERTSPQNRHGISQFRNPLSPIAVHIIILESVYLYLSRLSERRGPVDLPTSKRWIFNASQGH